MEGKDYHEGHKSTNDTNRYLVCVSFPEAPDQVIYFRAILGASGKEGRSLTCDVGGGSLLFGCVINIKSRLPSSAEKDRLKKNSEVRITRVE